MGSIMSILSELLYLSEKVTLYLACTSLITCLVLMFVVSLGMGVGLGYNYCFVDLKTRVKYVPAHYQYYGSPRWPYVREGAPGPVAQEVPDAEDENLRSLMTTPPEEETVPSFEPGSFVNYSAIENNDTYPLLVYTVSFPNDGDDEDFSVTSANTTSIANATSEMYTTKEADEVYETKTVETTETSEETTETTVSSTEEISSVHEPDNINELDEPTPEPSTNSNDEPNNRRVKKLVIPISGLDLISLLSKLKAEHKNYSLQIVTT